MNAQLETRHLTADLTELEIRSTEDGKQKIAGYAARFNVLSENLGGFREKIAPGAFTRSINEAVDVVAVVDHSTRAADLLGRTSTGTLTLKPNQKGLYFEVDLPDTQTARDIRAILARPNELKMSFAFTVAEGGDRWEQIDGLTVRELVDVNLRDISIVVHPAYPQTELALRSMQAWQSRNLEPYYRQKWAELHD